MELRLRKLIAEIQADYWMESKAPYGLDDEEVSGRDLAQQHTAEEALHLRSFLRTSALVIQFCRRIQLKFSHADVEGAVKAAKALSHLLIRSQEELYEEIQRVKSMGARGGSSRFGRGHRKGSDALNFFIEFLLRTDEQVAQCLGGLDCSFDVSMAELQLDSSAELDNKSRCSQE